MKLIVAFKGEDFEIKDLSKAETVKEFQKKVEKATGVSPKGQQILAFGKFLSSLNNANLCDYRLEDGHKVILMAKEPLQDLTNKDDDTKTAIKKEASPPPFMDEREPDDPKPDDVKAGSSKDEEDNECCDVTDAVKEETIKNLKEIGLDEATIKTIVDEQQPDNDELCKRCKANPKRKCFECGCKVCGSRENPELQLFCEECQYSTHCYCLDPEMTVEEMKAIPDDEDWYCKDCELDRSQIVGRGEAIKMSKRRAEMPSNAKKQTRDWGKGQATAAVKDKCTIVGNHYFGPIPGIDVGMLWQYRTQVASSGTHRPPVAGIAGQSAVGCQSIILAGGYEDDEDNGEEFYYCGAGGRDLSGNKRTDGQSFDQKLTRDNLSMAGKKN